MELLKWEHTEAVLRDYALAAEELMKDNLLRDGRVASGFLMDSITTRVVVGRTSLAVEMDLASYWKYVEMDTRPHIPPHLPIFWWVKAKRLLPTNDRTGQVRVRGKNKGIPYTREDMEHSLAHAIQHKIGKEGTKGRHTLEETCRQLNAEYAALINTAIEKDFSDAGDVIVQMWSR